jgi:hypothetical protein
MSVPGIRPRPTTDICKPGRLNGGGIAMMAATIATLEDRPTFVESLHKQFIPMVFWIWFDTAE